MSNLTKNALSLGMVLSALVFGFNAQANTAHRSSCDAGASYFSSKVLPSSTGYSAGCELYLTEMFSAALLYKRSDEGAAQYNGSINKFFRWNKHADVIVQYERQETKLRGKKVEHTNALGVGYRIHYQSWDVSATAQVRKMQSEGVSIGLSTILTYKLSNNFTINLKALGSDNDQNAGLSIGYRF
ncbi:hypothetical protein [Pseudoalteromonas sp. T1lg23B]|uniref:hypothetical protein n=1 Tax=Pseudoalteromonas sp. T1lg23B TaxID=2077097 RepID=UPI000CF5F4F9|nr:hypothetical protein [Pseudoalteromonas sp. T1lg23B]